MTFLFLFPIASFHPLIAKTLQQLSIPYWAMTTLIQFARCKMVCEFQQHLHLSYNVFSVPSLSSTHIVPLDSRFLSIFFTDLLVIPTHHSNIPKRSVSLRKSSMIFLTRPNLPITGLKIIVYTYKSYSLIKFSISIFTSCI